MKHYQDVERFGIEMGRIYQIKGLRMGYIYISELERAGGLGTSLLWRMDNRCYFI